jgi:RNA-binding protein YlmH
VKLSEDVKEEKEETEFVEVGAFDDPAEVMVIKSLLQSEGIPFHAQGDSAQGRARPRLIRFLVPKQFSEQALQLIKENPLQKNKDGVG